MKFFIGFIFLSAMATNCKKNNTVASQPQPQPGGVPIKYGAKLVADGPGNTYELINSVLGGDATEDPDCAHPSFGRHIREEFDNTLNKNVFDLDVQRSGEDKLVITVIKGNDKKQYTIKEGEKKRIQL